jgi:hypothetical protein
MLGDLLEAIVVAKVLSWAGRPASRCEARYGELGLLMPPCSCRSRLAGLELPLFALSTASFTPAFDRPQTRKPRHEEGGWAGWLVCG